MRPSQSIFALVVSATLGVGGAEAQERLPTTGPYYLMGVTDQAVTFVAGGTVTKSGDHASVTVIAGSSRDKFIATGFGRVDMLYEFNCPRGLMRTPLLMGYSPDDLRMAAHEDPGDWQAITPNTPASRAMAFACEGTVAPGSELPDTIDAVIQMYQLHLDGQ